MEYYRIDIDTNIDIDILCEYTYIILNYIILDYIILYYIIFPHLPGEGC